MDYTNSWQIGLLGSKVQSTVEIQIKCNTNVTVLKTYQTMTPERRHVLTVFITSCAGTCFDIVLTLDNPFDPVLAVTNSKHHKGLKIKNK